ncbi:hypothetical protein JAAARDRAFT_649746 [Jaapia argillacea MUCL 33604]|uniref:Uncharacterized protein n=1 Tax=Jaapia argillacea MUCL 33604 TaxID=933084 RepID=A0A067PVZ9_9AGAM|nr:hypothetical protein JAAARDRAFT_649746 [Jaapia argillacea MUCL 33604]
MVHWCSLFGYSRYFSSGSCTVVYFTGALPDFRSITKLRHVFCLSSKTHGCFRGHPHPCSPTTIPLSLPISNLISLRGSYLQYLMASTSSSTYGSHNIPSSNLLGCWSSH